MSVIVKFINYKNLSKPGLALQFFKDYKQKINLKVFLQTLLNLANAYDKQISK